MTRLERITKRAERLGFSVDDIHYAGTGSTYIKLCWTCPACECFEQVTIRLANHEECYPPRGEQITIGKGINAEADAFRWIKENLIGGHKCPPEITPQVNTVGNFILHRRYPLQAA